MWLSIKPCVSSSTKRSNVHPLLFFSGIHLGSTGQPSSLKPDGHSCLPSLQSKGQYPSHPITLGMQTEPLLQPWKNSRILCELYFMGL